MRAMRVVLALFCSFIILAASGCATGKGGISGPGGRTAERPPAVAAPSQVEPVQAAKEPVVNGWTERVITEDEISEICRRSPELSPEMCRKILARLNIKAHYHISDDIRLRRPLRVPRDFRAYRDWTPMPQSIAGVDGIGKLIIVTKDVPFLGWYERGRLAGDAMACIGNTEGETQAGVYSIKEKDPDHYSRSYSNSFGKPAWMPWSLRIYEAVWIHAGDITGAHCSHGCVTLPLKEAEELFRWADSGTIVVIVESLKDVDRVIRGGLKPT